jgi:hypothetical protein
MIKAPQTLCTKALVLIMTSPSLVLPLAHAIAMPIAFDLGVSPI